MDCSMPIAGLRRWHQCFVVILHTEQLQNEAAASQCSSLVPVQDVWGMRQHCAYAQTWQTRSRAATGLRALVSGQVCMEQSACCS